MNFCCWAKGLIKKGDRVSKQQPRIGCGYPSYIAIVTVRLEAFI